MTPDSGYPDESSRSTATVDIPTTVPSSFYAQAQGDMLNQQVQADAASNALKSQLISDHVNSLGQIADIKQLDQQMQPVRNASQYIGSNAWGSGHNTYCETFAEQMTDGKNMGDSAADAFQNRLQSGQAVADPSLQGVQPGDLVYFGGAQENGGYGHVGVYAGNGRIISASVNGIQNYPISAFNAPVTGYARTGGGTGGMGVVGENTGGGSGANMNAPMAHENKVEGGDNMPPPSVSGGSWAPPSADAFKDWFGSQVSKIFNTPENSGAIAGQQISDLGSAVHGAADQAASTVQNAASTASDALSDPNGMENLQQGLKSAGGTVLGGALDLGMSQAPLTDQERQDVHGVIDPAVSHYVDQSFANARQRIADIGSGDPNRSEPAVTDVLLSTMGSKGDLGNNINPAHVPEDVMPALDSTYERNAPAIDAARRGVVPNAQTLSDAQDLADATGNPVQKVISDWQPGDVQNAAMMTAVRNAMVDARRQALDAAEAWGADPSSQNQMAKMGAQAAADRVQMVAQGLTAELGRGLQAMGIDVTDPLVVRRLADDPQFVSSMQSSSNAKAPIGQAARDASAGSRIYAPSGDAAQAAPQAQDMLPGFEPPAVGQNTVQAAGKPFEVDALQPGEVAADNAGKQYPVFQGPAPDTGPSGAGLNVPALKGIQNAQDFAKQVLVSLSVFHPFVEEAQLGRTFLSQGKPIQGLRAMTNMAHAAFSPKFTEAYMQANRFDARQAEAAGETLLRGNMSPDYKALGPRIVQSALGAAGSGLSGYAEAKATGASDEDAVGRGVASAAFGAAAGAVAPAVSEALWGRMVPVAKLEAFKVLAPKYGAEAAATSANNIFGGQNLAKLGRTRQVQDVARLALLAPDWLESWARNAGAPLGIGVEHGISGPEAQIARRYWAATLIGGAVTLEGLNVAFNGHTTDGNEPGHRFELETTGLFEKLGQHPTKRTYMDINALGPFGSALTALDRGVGKGDPLGTPGAFLNSHLNVAPAALLAADRNVDYTGKQIVPRGTSAQEAVLPEAGAVARRVTPIGLGSFQNDGVPASQQLVSAITGLRSSAGGYTAPGGFHPSGPAASGYRPFKPGSGGYKPFKRTQ